VDDEDIVRETIRDDLMEAGYDVVDARNGLEGIRQFKNGAIDLVISDLIMDGMDGLGVLKEVKKYLLIPPLLLSRVTSLTKSPRKPSFWGRAISSTSPPVWGNCSRQYASISHPQYTNEIGRSSVLSQKRQEALSIPKPTLYGKIKTFGLNRKDYM